MKPIAKKITASVLTSVCYLLLHALFSVVKVQCTYLHYILYPLTWCDYSMMVALTTSLYYIMHYGLSLMTKNKEASD